MRSAVSNSERPRLCWPAGMSVGNEIKNTASRRASVGYPLRFATPCLGTTRHYTAGFSTQPFARCVRPSAWLDPVGLTAGLASACRVAGANHPGQPFSSTATLYRQI